MKIYIRKMNEQHKHNHINTVSSKNVKKLNARKTSKKKKNSRIDFGLLFEDPHRSDEL